MSGERNAVKDEFILSRERSGASELVRVSHPDIEEPIYALWSGVKKHKPQTPQLDGAVETVIPKHTGGKKPYVMLMEGSKGIIIGLSLEASGLMLKLFYGGHIEWHTGRIISKQDKKSMAIAGMSKWFKVSRGKLRKILTELSAGGVVRYDPKKHAYFADRSIARKGRSL